MSKTSAEKRESMRAPSPAGSPVAPDLDVDPTAITRPSFAKDHPNPSKADPSHHTVLAGEAKPKPSWRREKKTAASRAGKGGAGKEKKAEGEGGEGDKKLEGDGK